MPQSELASILRDRKKSSAKTKALLNIKDFSWNGGRKSSNHKEVIEVINF